MTKYLSAVLILFAANLFAAGTYGPVYYRTNDFSFSPTNALSSNLVIGAGLAKFQGPNGVLTISNTWATNDLATIDYVNSLNQFAEYWYVWGSSNSPGATNAAGTAYKVMQRSDVPMTPTANTNTYVNPANGTYIAEVITAIPAGISSMRQSTIMRSFYAFISSGGISVTPEIYVRTNLYSDTFTDFGEREIAVGTAVALSTTPQQYITTINLETNVAMTATNYLVMKLKVSGKTGNPTVSMVSQDSFPAYLGVPIQSAEFVMRSGDTMSGPLVINSRLNVNGTQSNDYSGVSGKVFSIGSNGVARVSLSNEVLTFNVVSNTGLQFQFQTSGVSVVTIYGGNQTNAGYLQAGTFRSVGYILSGGDIFGGLAYGIGVAGRYFLKTPASGVLSLLDGAYGPNFYRLQFGGISTNYPSLINETATNATAGGATNLLGIGDATGVSGPAGAGVNLHQMAANYVPIGMNGPTNTILYSDGTALRVLDGLKADGAVDFNLSGTTGNTPPVQFRSNSAITYFQINTNGTTIISNANTAPLEVYSSNNPTPVLTVSTNGKVGIGISAPVYPLHVIGYTYATAGLLSPMLSDSLSSDYSVIRHGGSAKTLTFSADNADRQLIRGQVKALTDATITSLITITSRTNSFVGGRIDYTIHCSDNTERQALSGIVTYSGVNTNGVWCGTNCVEVAANQSKSVTSGTITTTWDMYPATSGGTTNVTIRVNCDSSLTPAAGEFYILWQLNNNGTNTITAL